MNDNGVILERLSGKKLLVLVICLVLVQFMFVMIGFLKFPNATHIETIEGMMCKNRPSESTLYLRDYLGRSLSNCERIDVDESKNVILNVKQKDIVYAFQLPLPRDNKVLSLSRWFQTMTSMLQLQVIFPNKLANIEEDTSVSHDIAFNVTLAYRNQNDYDDDWHLLANSKVKKQFTCLKSMYSLDCDMVQLFELGSVHHQFYTINIKFDDSKLTDSLKLYEKLYSTIELPEVRLVMTFIYQTGGFTKMWLITKTSILPFLCIILIWFAKRIIQLNRKMNVMEKMLLALGTSSLVLNLPFEWFTLFYELNWMLLFTDLRQGIFYTILFSFWIVFCGEHYVDQERSSLFSLKSYWNYIGVVWLGSISLLVFELSQRGMQLSNPFYSIWDSENGSHLATGVLVLACASGVLYFALLLYLSARVFFNFKAKQAQLPSMSRMRRVFYEGIMYRFKFLFLATLICAAMTISFFIINNLNETHWRFSDDSYTINFTGGFQLGVYGMWNLYVIAVLIFYAPSHKFKSTNDDSVEFVNMKTSLSQNVFSSDATTETTTATTLTANTSNTESILSAFANKLASS
jgi:hypothetical protein